MSSRSVLCFVIILSTWPAWRAAAEPHARQIGRLVRSVIDDTERVRQLAALLDSSKFPERERATKALIGMGPAVAAQLKTVRPTSLEGERRQQRILQAVTPAPIKFSLSEAAAEISDLVVESREYKELLEVTSAFEAELTAAEKEAAKAIHAEDKQHELLALYEKVLKRAGLEIVAKKAQRIVDAEAQIIVKKNGKLFYFEGRGDRYHSEPLEDKIELVPAASPRQEIRIPVEKGLLRKFGKNAEGYPVDVRYPDGTSVKGSNWEYPVRLILHKDFGDDAFRLQETYRQNVFSFSGPRVAAAAFIAQMSPRLVTLDDLEGGDPARRIPVPKK